jgi:calcium binding protein 39
MAFLFRKSAKPNIELVRSTKELTIRLSEETKPNPKVRMPTRRCRASD